jgi:orotidine-5'-phosphate decarboxylase
MSAQHKLEQGLSRQGPLCIGLDPDPAKLPALLHGEPASFLIEIVAATADLASAFKINMAFFEALGREGLQALERVRQAIPPSALLIWDARRGDIENTNRHHARSAFEVWNADAVTVHPYLGIEPLAPFFDYLDRLTFVLCATSEGSTLQDLRIAGSDEPVWSWVAREVARTSRGQCGLVVGATRPAQLRAVRKLAPALPLLVPGVGAQGGDIPAQPALVNVSRAVLYASSDSDFATAARRAAESLRDRCMSATSGVGQAAAPD